MSDRNAPPSRWLDGRIEAILMVADRPGRARSCWPSSSSCRWRRWRRSATSWRRVRGRRRGLHRSSGGRRLPLPEPPRPGAVRRAVRARRPDGPAVGGGARDVGHRGLQAADLAGAGRLDPGRQRRRRHAHARAARLHRRGRPRPGPGQAVAVRHDAGVPREARARLGRRPAADRRVRPRAQISRPAGACTATE